MYYALNGTLELEVWRSGGFYVCFSFIDSTYISGILRVKNRTFILISAYSRMAFWHLIAVKSQLSATQDPSLCTRPQAHPR